MDHPVDLGRLLRSRERERERERVVPLGRCAFAVGGPEPLHHLALLCERDLQLLNTG